MVSDPLAAQEPDASDLSAEEKRRIEVARQEAAEGKTIPFAVVMKKARL